MKSNTIRVRFAPSPTGHLHVGGARTALFNYLFARHNNGVLILRIEDTDRSRSTEEYIQAITEGMKWLGLDWDEGPFRQTDRFEIYREHAIRLLEKGKAYRCYCTPEELEQRRKEAQEKGELPRYDRRCRDLKTDYPDKPCVIRIKIPLDGETVVQDLTLGEVVFQHNQLDDFILVRSDGAPTYNFCVVVDDVTMKITHVIRGNDHLANTPKQILLYQALGYAIPEFAHIPMILGPDRTRLSKRHGATSIVAYRDMGYLPEAMVNYLARLGWAHGDQEIFSKDELIEYFTLEKVGKTAAVFDPAKLEWLNAHYIKQMDITSLAGEFKTFLSMEGYTHIASDSAKEEWLKEIVTILKERAKTLKEMVAMGRFFFSDDIIYEKKASAQFLIKDNIPYLDEIYSLVNSLAGFAREEIETGYRQLSEKLGVKLVHLAQLTRVALTGGTVSPGIFEVMVILGKDKILSRIDKARNYISNIAT